MYRDAGEMFLWQTRRRADGGTTERTWRWRAAGEDGAAAAPAVVGRSGHGGSWRLMATDRDGTYDARRRPFFRAAVAAGAATWTEPYVFLPEGEPGVTYATPVYAAGAGDADKDHATRELRGVLTVDFSLERPQKLVRELRPAAGGRAWLFDPAGPLLAHSDREVVDADADGGFALRR